jgi:hypothetical protein
MAKAKGGVPPPVAEVLTLESKATCKPTRIKLSDLDLTPSIYSHRDASIYLYKADDVDNLARKLIESLIISGQKVPVAYCIEDGKKLLLCGWRRVEAMKSAIQLQLDPERFHAEMEIDALEISSQDPRDLLEWSITDNEVRQGLTEAEKLLAAAKMLKANFSASRAAHALGVSPTLFARYQRRLNSDVIRAAVQNDDITATDGDTLLEAAATHNRTKDLERGYLAITTQIERHISQLREEATRRGDAFDDKKQGQVGRYIKPHHVKGWAEDLKQGRSLSWTPEEEDQGGWTFECKVDPREGKLSIGRLKTDLHTMSLSDLGQVAFKLCSVARLVEAFFRKKQAEAAIWTQDQDQADTEDMIGYFRRQGAVDLADDLQRKVDRTRGEADPGHGKVQPRRTKSVADAIQVPPSE